MLPYPVISAAGYGKKHSKKVIDVKPEGTPGPLQGIADEVIEIKAEQQPEWTVVGRNKNKCDQAPYLSMKQGVPAQIQPGYYRDIKHVLKEIYRQHCAAYIHHQIMGWHSGQTAAAIGSAVCS